MPSDLEALLAAVVANPADDVARLVYADCLEEQGNTPRARFIRLQVEAARHDHATRSQADVADEARALFAAHWVEWWAEVCAATGLRAPAGAPKSALGRLARRAGVGTRAGAPYAVQRFTPFGFDVYDSAQLRFERTRYFEQAMFERGFPEQVMLNRAFEGKMPDLLARWGGVSPLTSLSGTLRAFGSPGPHLAGLKDLTLDDANAPGLAAWLDSPHLSRLDSLAIVASDEDTQNWDGVLGAARHRQLKRLSLSCPSDYDEVLFATTSFNALRELYILAMTTAHFEFAARFLAEHGSRLQEIDLFGPQTRRLVSLFCGRSWPDLRQIFLDLSTWDVPTEVVAAAPNSEANLIEVLTRADLPALDELHLMQPSLTDAVAVALVGSPLLRKLRHFSLTMRTKTTGLPAALCRLADAFDSARIESILVLTDQEYPEFAELSRAFGDRVRFDRLPQLE